MWRLWNKLPQCYTYKEYYIEVCKRIYCFWAFNREWIVFKERIESV